jgi:eukaryotic-like serine/threonine-protein kinase
MGEVYRARDTRLGREVAVKVLPEEASSSDEWRKRFEREAKAISKLAHPHVCALFDVGRQGDVDYLVMELLSGVTLAARLAKGPLPLEEVLRFGAEIASALAATHAVGIAHGDLKPSNVMVTRSGVKLLDYGVARSLTPPRAAARDATWESTVSHAQRPEGEVVGTFPYMAPEQFDGKAADASTDVFALGAVLFEMATGKRAFPGNSSAEIISAVRTLEPPPVCSLQPASLPPFDRLVRTCLAKNPEERWSSAHDVGLVLRQLQEGEGVTPSARAAVSRWALLAGGLVLVALGVAAALVLRPARDGPALAASMQFLLAPPPDNSFYWNVERDSLALSPDGSQLAFVAVNSRSEHRLWVRGITNLDARPLPTSEGASSVFWSPDGRSIGFFAKGMLQRIDLPNGDAVLICPVDSDVGLSGTWGKGGDILFAAGGKIMRVPANGGAPSIAVQPDPARGESLRWPWFLPDGERFLYTTGKLSRSLVMAAPGQASKELLPVGSKVQFSGPGFLVFARDGSLLAQRFDWREGTLTGKPFVVAKHVRGFVSTGAAEYATSLNGTLVLQTADDAQRLAVLERTGHELGTLTGSGNYHDFTISPSGARVAFSRATPGLGTADVWLFDVERGVETRITSAPDDEIHSVWLPGEKALFYSVSAGPGLPHLVRRDLETETEMEAPVPKGGFQIGEDVSPDGSFLLYSMDFGTVWKLPITGPGKPSPVLPSRFHLSSTRFSPDGRYVAFISDESGEQEAYIAPHPGPGAKVRISSNGAVKLRWNRGVGTIFYSDRDGRLWSVPVSTQPVLHIGARTALFMSKSLEPNIRPDPEAPAFDVFPDGKRILVAVPEVIAGELPLTAVLNWPAAAPN